MKKEKRFTMSINGKQLLKFNKCWECPFMRYESYQSCIIESGWDCSISTNENYRIVDDSVLKNMFNDNLSNIPIPNWCPLLR